GIVRVCLKGFTNEPRRTSQSHARRADVRRLWRGGGRLPPPPRARGARRSHPPSLKKRPHPPPLLPAHLLLLPPPPPQLYNRAHNAKDPRNRHDNAYYLFEALVKLMAAPLVAAYLHAVRHGGTRVDGIDRQLRQLALPSLGQWVGIVREVARHFGTHPE